MCNEYREVCFNQENLEKHRFASMRLSWKEILYGVETYWLPGKEKVPLTPVRKGVMLTVFKDMKGPISIDSLEKCATVISVSYW